MNIRDSPALHLDTN